MGANKTSTTGNKNLIHMLLWLKCMFTQKTSQNRTVISTIHT